VIKFKCIYCGQRILAKDDGAGKKGKCPKCNHLLTVPESTKGRPAISPTKEPMPDRPAPPHVPEWSKGNFDGIDGKEEWTELFKESFGFLLPAYDNLSFFLIAVTWILLYAANNLLREQIHTFLFENHDWKVTLIALTIPAVLILGIYQVFAKREKSAFERTILLAFAIATNILTGLVAGIYVLRNTDIRSWQIIFPIWNIINAVILYLMLEIIFTDENCVSDRHATLPQIVFGLIAILIIFFICNNVFKLHWAITYSICIIYTTSFDRALQSVFPGWTGQKYEQSEV
jgi:hypothetical protein